MRVDREYRGERGEKERVERSASRERESREGVRVQNKVYRG